MEIDITIINLSNAAHVRAPTRKIQKEHERWESESIIPASEEEFNELLGIERKESE